MDHTPEHESAERSLLRYGWSKRRVEGLFKVHMIDNDLRPYPYPWNDAEEQLRSHGHNSINLIGYGSLMNPASAARTIRDTPPTGHPPVVALGARRVFNYQIPPPVFVRYGVEPGENDRAALNAEPAACTLMNGRCIQVHVDDMPGLRERETAYDLQPVTCLDWY
ncbi:MAG: hypothetical protein QM796_20410 [Chthoniobacteraceae bacterium]